MLMRPSSDRLRLAPAARDLLDEVAARAHPSHRFLRSAWFEAAAPCGLATIAVLREDGTPIAALPRVKRRFGPTAVAEVPGCYWPFRSFPIAADTTDGELVAMLTDPRFRAHFGQIWRMGPVYADDPTAARLRDVAQDGGWAVMERRLGTVYEVDVAALTREGPWPRPSTLKRNRQRERRLQEIGPVQFRFASGDAWSDADLDAMAEIEAHSWVSEKGGDAKFLDPACRGIWEKLAQDPVIANMLFAGLVLVGEQPAAFSFGLDVGDVRYNIATGYNPSFAVHSPGKIVISRNFERAVESGIRKISRGAGDAGYKTEMDALPGPEILDLLFVRPALAMPLRKLWTGSFRSS